MTHKARAVLTIVSIALVMCLFCPVAKTEPIYEPHSRVEFGLRTSSYSLSDTTGDFVGTINQLKGTDSITLRPYLNLIINRYLLIEFQFEEFEARTYTSSGKSDGDLTLNGPILSIIGRYPNFSAFIPFAGVGLASLNASFDAEPHWALGYAGPEEWAAEGSPSELYGGRSRTMVPDDDIGLMTSIGCVWQFSRKWSAEAYARYLSTRRPIQVHYEIRVHDVVTKIGEGSFPVESIFYGIGIRYTP